MGFIQDQLDKDPSSVLLDGVELTKKEEAVEPGKKVEDVKPDADKKVEEPEKNVEIVPTPEFDKKKFITSIFDQEFDDETQAAEHYRSLKQSATETEAYKKKIEELEAGLDPLKYFANENEYKRQMLLKQFPEYDPQLLTTITVGDLDKLSPIDIIALKYQLKDPDIYKSKESALKVINKTFGYDPELTFEEQDEVTQLEILKSAKEAKKDFNEIKSKISLPEKVDLKAVNEKQAAENLAKQETLKVQLRPLLETIPLKLKDEKITLKDIAADGSETVVFEYQIDDDYIKEVEKEITKTTEVLAQRGVDLNAMQKNKILEDTVKQLKDTYVAKNIDKVLKAFKTKLDKDYADREVNEYHNPRRPSQQEASKTDNVQQESISKTESRIEAHLRGERV